MIGCERWSRRRNPPAEAGSRLRGRERFPGLFAIPDNRRDPADNVRAGFASERCADIVRPDAIPPMRLAPAFPAVCHSPRIKQRIGVLGPVGEADVGILAMGIVKEAHRGVETV